MAQSLIGTLPDALSRPNPRPAGQQRACPPQETLDALKPRFDELGITRLADITGLDRIGIPVVQAICPLSKSLTVKQGKGEDLAAAATSAAMEAAEAWHAESISAPPVAVPEVPNCILDLSGLSPMPTRLSGHTNSISWIQGWDLLNGGPLWGPFDCITLDFTVPLQCASLQRGSNGLASGNTVGEAIYHALCEVIERDCIADFERRTPRSRARAVQSFDDLRAYGAGALMDKIGEAEMILRVWDITNDLCVPAFRALLYDVGTQGPGKYVHPPKVGYGCHLDPKIAVSRAITEAAQSRLVAISGARDDLVPEDYAPPQMGNALVALTSVADAAAAGDCKARHISSASASAETDSRFLLQRLAERGLEQVAGFDLTHPKIGLPVVRILAPGLGGLSTGHRSYAGTRHQKVSVQ